MPRALIVEILGNAKQFGDELDKAAGKTRQMGKVAGVAGLAIAGGLAVGLEKSVKAAMAAQTSTARMDAAFKQSGQSADAYAGRIDQAESSSRNLGFSNIDVRQSLGSLEIATHNGSQAIKDLGTAQDIARFKGIGLTDASKMLTMAMSGSQRATKQLGLSIQPVTSNYDALKATMKGAETAQQKQELAAAKAIDKQKTAAEVIQIVSQKLHGQADAYSQTAAGGMARFHAQMEMLQESIGNALLPALTQLSQVVADAASWMAKHAEVAKALVVVLGGLAATLLLVSVYTKLANAATVIWTATTKLAEAAQWALNAALDANPIGLVVIALAALGAALYLAWTKSQTFRDIVKGVWADIKQAVQTVVNFFTNDVVQAFETVKNKLVNAFTSVKDWLSNHWPEIATLLSGPFAPLVLLATGAFGVREKLLNAFGDLKQAAGNVWDGVKAAWATAWNGIEDAVVGPIKTVISWIQQLIGWIAKIHVPHISVPGLHLPHIHIPGLQGGGIVTKPTLAVVGEAGPEAVLPLSHLGVASGPGGGAASTINVTVNGWVGSDQQIARHLRNELVALGRIEAKSIFAGYA